MEAGIKKNLYAMAFPTIDLLRQFKELNIFDENQMSVLRDPIVSIRNLPRLKNEKNLIEIEKLKELFVAVGRFTKQKFHFSVNNFIELKRDYQDIKLIILGDGELLNKVKKIVTNKNLQKDILILGYQNNVFKFFPKAQALILRHYGKILDSVIIEAAACNLNIISSDCKNGPRSSC